MDADIPWVEKYRPQNFEDIILDDTTRILLNNMIQRDQFPNILAYGFPGTGKTTTIINIISKYMSFKGKSNMADVIHLNASDDRGIEIIRTHIHTFVTCKSLFANENTIKFVILDEVDYMTKNAQQALKYLMQTTHNSIRFLLICNYVSRIDDGLQNEFVKIHFNVVPPTETIDFLNKICIKERLRYSMSDLHYIRNLFVYDIRSMINYMQMNQNNTTNILKPELLCALLQKFTNQDMDIYEFIQLNSQKYNLDERRFILHFLQYLMKDKKTLFFQKNFLDFIQHLLHNNDVSNRTFVLYFIKSLLKTLST